MHPHAGEIGLLNPRRRAPRRCPQAPKDDIADSGSAGLVLRIMEFLIKSVKNLLIRCGSDFYRTILLVKQL